MRLVNPSQLGFAPMPARLAFPAHSITLIAKLTLRLVHRGACERIADEQQPFPTGDVPYGDDEQGVHEPRYPSDFVPVKPGADAVLVGHYHAPSGEPVRFGRAAFQIGTKQLRVQVVGERNHGGTIAPWPDFEKAKPFTSLPLRWKHAFGGTGFAINPVGVGYEVTEGRAGPLPRIERLGGSMSSPSSRPLPAGFGSVRADWPWRASLLGTFDERWKDERWPWYPRDFDPRFFQVASPPLRSDGFFVGDEALYFENLHPTIAEYHGRLPGLRAIAAVARGAESAALAELAYEAVAMVLDTVWVDMDAERVVLVWRGHCATADPEFSDLRFAFVDLEPCATPSSDKEVVATAERGIAADEALWEFKEEPPPPANPAIAPAPESASESASDSDSDSDSDNLPLPLPDQNPNSNSNSDPNSDPDPAPIPWTPERLLAALSAGESVSGTDLSGLQLQGAALAATNLSGAILDGANLSGADLSSADLSHASLRGADLSGANLANAKLEGADLTRSRASEVQAQNCVLDFALLAGAEWPDAQLAGAQLREVDATAARFEGAIFDGADLGRAHFERARLDRTSFVTTSLAAVDLVGASLRDAVFEQASLAEGDASLADLQGATFEDCDWTQLDLESTQLVEAELRVVQVEGLRAAGANFSRALLHEIRGKDPIFEGASFADAVLMRAELPGADFTRADLQRAQLMGCVLKGARFGKADLRGAQLRGSDCFEAVFERANLEACDGTGSSFYGAEFLDAEVRGFTGADRNLTMTKLAKAT